MKKREGISLVAVMVIVIVIVVISGVGAYLALSQTNYGCGAQNASQRSYVNTTDDVVIVHVCTTETVTVHSNSTTSFATSSTTFTVFVTVTAT